MAHLLLETRPRVSNVTLLHPEVLWLVFLLLPLLVVGALWLGGLARWRRRAALLLEVVSLLALLVTLAAPVRLAADDSLRLVLVLDASDSVSAVSREQAQVYAQTALRSAAPGTHVQVIAAGRQPRLLTADEVQAGISPPVVDGSASDLAAGLRLAGSLLPDAGKRRIVLLSDGWETTDGAASEATRLTSRGIDLQVVALTALGQPEVIAESLDIPAYARLGDTIAGQLAVYSTAPATATVRLSVDGRALATRSVHLAAGTTTIPLEQRAATLGFHRLEVAVTSDADTVTQNNVLSAGVVVKPAPAVLVIEERPGEAAALAAALSGPQMRVDVRSPSAIPARPDALDTYDGIILNNVAATSLTLDQQRTLQEYVRREGRGLTVVGGQTSYARGGYLESVLEDVLPVSSQPAPRPQQGATALILVIDRSASMDEWNGNDTTVTKFSMAKEAGRLAIDSLRVGDTVGVLSFDTETQWDVPVQVIGNENDKENIKVQIANIPKGRGTAIYPALADAAYKMRIPDAPSKHIVLLTDGREVRNTGDYEALLDQMRADNVTLSTIGIGRDADRDLLTHLANLGKGRYYFTEQTRNIPKIIFRELNVALKEAVLQGQVQPHPSAPSPILRGFAPQDVPQLGGYDITTAKDDAVTALVSDQGDPLLAHWQYGLGRVLAWTSDAGPGWAARWLTWDAFARFWDGAVRWTLPSPVNRALQPSITVSAPPDRMRAGVAHLAVESLNADNSFADLTPLTAALQAPSGVITQTRLIQTAPGHYEAAVLLDEQGTYEVRLVRQDGVGTTTETAGFSTPPAAELQHAGTNTRLLARITGGPWPLTDPAQALNPANLQGAASVQDPLWPFFLVLALLALVAGVAVRRLDFRRR
jgi:uncharacterized membrane protein